MLRVTAHNGPDTWRLQLEGKLAGEWVAEAERTWTNAPAGKAVEVDLRGVTATDSAGTSLLQRMHAAGARLTAEGVAMRALVDEVRRRRRAGAGARVLTLAALAVLAWAAT